jgi:hypothetical protein
MSVTVYESDGMVVVETDTGQVIELTPDEATDLHTNLPPTITAAQRNHP